MSALASRPFVSVKFSPVGRAITFLLDDIPVSVSPGDPVVVQDADGVAIGTAVRTVPALAPRKEPPAGSPKHVVRRATEQDIVSRMKQQHREQEARRVCLMKIRERGLPMKLTRVEQLFDGSKLIFYFTADTRVDFRELVRELAAEFRTRIELRQIGVRDEAKLLGGYGSCGRPLCCTTWLNGFEPVTIRMAKQQNLALNPSKLSGQCGRLKCCLRYELPNGKGVKQGGCAHGFAGDPEIFDEHENGYPGAAFESAPRCGGGCGGCSSTGSGQAGGCGSCTAGGCAG
jgi:cell fate regulator YaaT (PSP1 superfamily)